MHIGKVLLIAAMVILCLVFLDRLGSRRVGQRNDNVISSNKMAVFTRGNVHAEIQIGAATKIRYGRYTQLTANVRNLGDRFSGVLRVKPVGIKNGTVYEKQFELAHSGSKSLKLYLPVQTEKGSFKLTFLGEDGQVLYSGVIWTDVDMETDGKYVGICSRKKDRMRYMEESGTNVTYLSGEELPEDFRGLDWLDVLIASDIDLQTLQEAQVRAIINWVRNGGILVLADSGQAREISPFRGKLFEWKKQGSYDIATAFGVTEKDMKQIREEAVREAAKQKQQEVKRFLKKNLSGAIYKKWKNDISDLEKSDECIRPEGEIYHYLSGYFTQSMLDDFLSMKLTDVEKAAVRENVFFKRVHRELQELEVTGGKALLKTRKGKVILQEKKTGRGRVIISGVSLGLSSQYWDVQGRRIRNIIWKDFSEQEGRLREYKRDGGETEQIYEDGLAVTDWNKLPNLRFYIVFLIVYIVLTSPVFYYLMKRSRHRMAVWGMIPAASGLFAVLIYLIGTSTRLEGQCINYLNQIEVDSEGTGMLECHFRLIHDETGSYELSVDGGPVMESSQEQADGQKKTRLSQGEGKTTLQVEQAPSFEGTNLLSQDSVRLDGSIKVDLSVLNMHLLGRLENRSGSDLEDCMIYHNGVIYQLGDIADQKTYLLKENHYLKRYWVNDYSGNYERLADKLFTDTAKRTLTGEQKKRRWALLEVCMKKMGTTETFFYGFVPEEQEISGWYDVRKAKQQNMLGGIENIGCPKYGETGIMLRISIGGQTVLNEGDARNILVGGD